MIKLVASDMDGTLLDENGVIPPETFDLIRQLNEKGVRFCAASGRRYDTLLAQYAPVIGLVDFVASNGAQVVVQGKQVDLEVCSYLAVKRLYAAVQMFDNLHLALFDRVNSFLLDDESVFEREFDKNLPRPVRVFEVPDPEVSIIKASVFVDDASVMDMSYALTRELGDEFVFAPSGAQWIDAMQRGVTKETGIRQVMAVYDVQPDEVMAFGDSMNDYEILRMVGTSLAMGNARDAIKQISSRTIGTNAEQSVQRELRRLLESLD